MLSAFIFGVWVGYIVRILYKKMPSKMLRILLSGVFSIIAILLLVAVDVLPRFAGAWALFGAFGFYYAFGFENSLMEKLSASWAALWLLALFFIITEVAALFL